MKRSQCYLVLIASIFCSMAYAQERITLGDGSRLSVYIVKPAQTLSEPSPLVILMGGGPGNASISRDTSIWLGGGFAERGWMVAVPVSPNNRAFRGDENNHKVEQLYYCHLHLHFRSATQPQSYLRLIRLWLKYLDFH